MSRPVKRSFTLQGHRTSISLEPQFWEALKDAAVRERLSLSALVAQIDGTRGATNLSSAVRVWILAYFRTGIAQAREGGDRD